MIGKQLDMRTKNIDETLDALLEVKRKHGDDDKLTEALFNPDTKERLTVFQRKKLEKEGADLSRYHTSCSVCPKKKQNSEVSNIARGIFVCSEADLIDEIDGRYICEYCTRIGYDGKYNPEECDLCEQCIDCNDFINGECDGCGYSVMYNNGKTYGSENDEEEIIKDEDEALFDEIENENNVSPYKSNRGFTILDY